MNIVKLALPLVLLAASAQSLASSDWDCKVRSEPMNVVTDVIVVRPAGFVATAVGCALFVGLSPLTALASIPEPHDSFNRVGAILIGAPYGYTFVRPLGEFSDTCR